MTDLEAISQIEAYLENTDAYVSITAIRKALAELKNKEYKETHLLVDIPIPKLKTAKKQRFTMTIPILQEINRIYDLGNTISEIAVKYGVSYGTIRRYIWKPRNKAGNKKDE
jgi:DNA invertase Pin-like site-specific DNA recombinase